MRGLIRGRLLYFTERLGEQLGRVSGGDERTGLGERQPGCDMKNELFSVLFFALFGVPLLMSKKQKVLSSKQSLECPLSLLATDEDKVGLAWPVGGA